MVSGTSTIGLLACQHPKHSPSRSNCIANYVHAKEGSRICSAANFFVLTDAAPQDLERLTPLEPADIAILKDRRLVRLAVRIGFTPLRDRKPKNILRPTMVFC